MIGLGNPGKKYINTKHNIGSDWVIKAIESYGLELSYSSKEKSHFAYRMGFTSLFDSSYGITAQRIADRQPKFESQTQGQTQTSYHWLMCTD